MFQALRESIPAVQDRVYLNTGTSGPMPRQAYEKEVELLEFIVREGFSAPQALAAYSRTLDEARKALASVLSCDPQWVALTHSTSDGIGTVAAGIDWQPGDEVIISDLEHVSGVAPWAMLARRRGVVVRNIESAGGYLEPERVLAAITSRTRLICISHVSYASGAVLPVRDVCAGARKAGVLVVIDGAQSVGHVPVQVEQIGCDFYAFPGQKWLLGPEGTGGLYVAPHALEAFAPSHIGWASIAGEGEGGSGISLHPDARRYETGTVHAPAFAALAESVGILKKIGWQSIFERAQSLAHLAADELGHVPGVRVLTPRWASSGLLTFAVDGVEPERVVKEVWAKRRVIIRSLPFPRALRASFHAFNDESDVKALVEAVADVLRHG